MYKDDKRRKNRLDNLKLLKVQELLFNEFIDKLKEPKIKKIKTKSEPKKKIKDEIKDEIKHEIKHEIKDEIKDEIKTDLLEGDLRIIESKVKNCITYKIKINDTTGKILYKNEGENNDKLMTKDKIIRKLLKEIYDKYKNRVIKIKLNNKQFIKDYKILIANYNEINNIEHLKNNNDSNKNKIINDIINKKDLIEIKDNIILIE